MITACVNHTNLLFAEKDIDHLLRDFGIVLYLTFKRRVKSHLPFASIIRRFNVYGSVHRKYIPIYIQQDAMLHGLFYLETTLHGYVLEYYYDARIHER